MANTIKIQRAGLSDGRMNAFCLEIKPVIERLSIRVLMGEYRCYICTEDCLALVFLIMFRYVAMFSRSLSVEYKQYGIDVQCQIPLLVATKMASIKKSSFFIPSPEQYSKASIRWIGYELFCVPYWTHALQWCLISSMPESVVNWCLLKYFLSLRKKMIQKELRQKK